MFVCLFAASAGPVDGLNDRSGEFDLKMYTNTGSERKEGGGGRESGEGERILTINCV